MVTHAVDFLHLADSIVCLKNGKIEFQGNYEECKNHPYLKELVKVHRGHKVERNQRLGAGITEERKKQTTQILTSVNDQLDDDDDSDEDDINKIDIDQIPSDSD